MLNYKAMFKEYSRLYTNYVIMSIGKVDVMKKTNWKVADYFLLHYNDIITMF